MGTARARTVPAPPAHDANFKPQPGDDNAVVVINLTSNIIELPLRGATWPPVMIGANVDKGIIGAHQPEVESTAGEVRRARMSPAVDMMFTGRRPALEVRGRLFSVAGKVE